MHTVILAWWLWTRLSEETTLKPKPMVEIGGKPIIWHIMKTYAAQGYNKFIVCLWYKGEYIKDWFANYYLHNSDVTIHTKNNKLVVHNTESDDREITLIDTWIDTLTAWRIKRVSDYIEWDEFMMTYWDGLSNINIKKLVEFHRSHGKLSTLTAVVPEARFGKLEIKDNQIMEFWEKKDNTWQRINWGYMVLNKKVMDFIDGDDQYFEKEPLENLAKKWQLMAYNHDGFRFAMDTLKQKNDLEAMWKSWKAPRKVW